MTYEARETRKYWVYEATPGGNIGKLADGAPQATRMEARIIAQREIQDTRNTYYVIEHDPFSGDTPQIVETVRP